MHTHALALSHTYTHIQMQLAIGEWQLKPMVKRSETNESRMNEENQVRNNKTKCRRSCCCCFLFCVVFRVCVSCFCYLVLFIFKCK